MALQKGTPESQKLVLRYETIPGNNNKSKNKLLLPVGNNNLKLLEGSTLVELSQLGKILSKPGLIELVAYFNDVRASTAQAAVFNLDTAASSVYRNLGILRQLNFIDVVTRSKAPRKSGPVPKIYGVRQVRPEDIQRAALAHIRFTSPIYPAVQATLNEFKLARRELAYRDILDAARPYSKGFKIADVADLVAQDLRDRGLTVWR